MCGSGLLPSDPTEHTVFLCLIGTAPGTVKDVSERAGGTKVDGRGQRDTNRGEDTARAQQQLSPKLGLSLLSTGKQCGGGSIRRPLQLSLGSCNEISVGVERVIRNTYFVLERGERERGGEREDKNKYARA